MARRTPWWMGIPGSPQATRLGCPQHPRGGCSSIPSRQARGYRAALPTRSPAGPTCGELAGRGGPPGRGRMLGDTLAWFPKGKKSREQQRGIPPSAVPAAPCLPRHPPHAGCALFACYFWQPPKSSSRAINNESEKFVWPLLYKER